MIPSEQQHYRPVLERLAEDIRRRLAGTDTAQPVSPDRAIGRLTRVEAMQAQQLSLAVRRRQQEQLARIDHALALLALGRYGACTKCGEDIDRARLDVNPATFLCVPCIERLRPAP